MLYTAYTGDAMATGEVIITGELIQIHHHGRFNCLPFSWLEFSLVLIFVASELDHKIVTRSIMGVDVNLYRNIPLLSTYCSVLRPRVISALQEEGPNNAETL